MDNILITLDGITATIFNKMREHKVYIDPTKSLDSRMNFVVGAMIKFIKSSKDTTIADAIHVLDLDEDCDYHELLADIYSLDEYDAPVCDTTLALSVAHKIITALPYSVMNYKAVSVALCGLLQMIRSKIVTHDPTTVITDVTDAIAEVVEEAKLQALKEEEEAEYANIDTARIVDTCKWYSFYSNGTYTEEAKTTSGKIVHLLKPGFTIIDGCLMMNGFPIGIVSE